MASVRIMNGPNRDQVFVLKGGELVGRDPQNVIQVFAPGVSRKHFQFNCEGGKFFVQDLGSSNGTYVNDRRITRQLMKAGDELRLDTIRFLLLAPGQEMAQQGPRNDSAAAAPAAAPKAAAGGSRMGLMWGFLVVAALTLGVLVARMAGLF